MNPRLFKRVFCGLCTLKIGKSAERLNKNPMRAFKPTLTVIIIGLLGFMNSKENEVHTMAKGDRWMLGIFIAVILYCGFCLWILLRFF